MNLKKSSIVAIIATTGCIAGILGLKSENKRECSTFALANIEALSKSEGSGRYKCYSSLVYEYGASVVECSTCQLMEDSSDAWYCIHDYCNR